MRNYYVHLENVMENEVITWASQRESPRLKMPFVIFFFRLQSQIAIWALKRMRACLIRGRGIDLQGFIQYCMQSLGSFRRISPWASFAKLADWYASKSNKLNGVARREMFICSKLGQNLSEMEVRTFVRIQTVIWDHLLASKAEIIQKQGSF